MLRDPNLGARCGSAVLSVADVFLACYARLLRRSCISQCVQCIRSVPAWLCWVELTCSSFSARTISTEGQTRPTIVIDHSYSLAESHFLLVCLLFEIQSSNSHVCCSPRSLEVSELRASRVLFRRARGRTGCRASSRSVPRVH